jgi:hypothetical protein
MSQRCSTAGCTRWAFERGYCRSAASVASLISFRGFNNLKYLTSSFAFYRECGSSMGAALPTQHQTSAATTGSSAPTVLSAQANPVVKAGPTPSVVKADRIRCSTAGCTGCALELGGYCRSAASVASLISFRGFNNVFEISNEQFCLLQGMRRVESSRICCL